MFDFFKRRTIGNTTVKIKDAPRRAIEDWERGRLTLAGIIEAVVILVIVTMLIYVALQ